MDKFKVCYIIIIIFCIIMMITKGIEGDIKIFSDDDSQSSRRQENEICIVPTIADGYQDTVYMSIPNCIIIVIFIIIALLLTINKNNTIKAKWYWLAGIILLAMFIPIAINYHIGGIVVTTKKINIYLWNIAFLYI